MKRPIINRAKVKEELIQRNLLSIHNELTKQRRLRIRVMSVLLAALLLTFIYGTLENPFVYTLSNIGNLFNYRLFFIIWAIVTGLSIQFTIVSLFQLEEYKSKSRYVFVVLACIALIVTALIPALKHQYPILHALHTASAVLHALFILLALNPFVSYISRQNPRLKKVITVWMVTIWIGSIVPLIILGNTGFYELWFFTTLIIFLLYLSMMLFEEKIVKLSVTFLKDEDNLNIAIEKIFINLEKANRRKR